MTVCLTLTFRHVRYTSTSALCTLGTIFRESTTVLSHYYDVFHEELQIAAQAHPSDEGIGKGLRAMEKNALQEKIAKPLGEDTLGLNPARTSATHYVSIPVFP
jgi:hypothetical protein